MKENKEYSRKPEKKAWEQYFNTLNEQQKREDNKILISKDNLEFFTSLIRQDTIKNLYKYKKIGW